MPEAKLIGFALCMLALVAVIPLLARRATREASAQVQQAREQIGARGFAVEHAASQYGRRIVRVWGRLDHPVRLRLRVRSRRRFRGDARGPGIGHAGGVADRFERHFRVTTNEPDRARLVLDPVVQEKLLAVQGHREIGRAHV